MEGVHSVLSTARIEYAYWTYEARDFAFKNSFLVHAEIGKIPFNAWTAKKHKLTQLISFGQIDHAPKLPAGHKIDNRGEMVR